MLDDLIDKLVALGREAAEPTLVHEDASEKNYLLGNGTAIDVSIPEPPRAHQVSCLSDLVVLANRFGAGAAVWYDEKAVVLVIDDDGHRANRVVFALEESDVFKRLKAIRAQQPSPWWDQKGFIRLLRIELAGTLEPGVLLNHVRKVRFETGAAINSTVNRNQESMGREINSKVDTTAELPEVVRLAVPVYKSHGERDRLTLNCTVEVDPTECTFQLLPLPDEIERVQQKAVESIGTRLIEGLGDVPAYYGRP